MTKLIILSRNEAGVNVQFEDKRPLRYGHNTQYTKIKTDKIGEYVLIQKEKYYLKDAIK